jgi:hypothetical protein
MNMQTHELSRRLHELPLNTNLFFICGEDKYAVVDLLEREDGLYLRGKKIKETKDDKNHEKK